MPRQKPCVKCGNTPPISDYTFLHKDMCLKCWVEETEPLESRIPPKRKTCPLCNGNSISTYPYDKGPCPLCKRG
jgi:hypothetical protein